MLIFFFVLVCVCIYVCNSSEMEEIKIIYLSILYYRWLILIARYPVQSININKVKPLVTLPPVQLAADIKHWQDAPENRILPVAWHQGYTSVAPA